MNRTTNIAASILLGVLVLTRLALAMLPDAPDSPIAVDSLRVLLVTEQTGGEWADEAEAIAMKLRGMDVQVQVRDPQAGVENDYPWVREGMKLVSGDPWVVIGSPQGGYSQTFRTADEVLKLVEGLR